MFATSHLDWLAVTYPRGVSPHYTVPRGALQSPLTHKGTGAHGYRTRLANAEGVSVMLDGTDDQGVHLTLSGSVLASLRDVGLTDRELCQYAIDNGGKVARMDAAVNIHAGNLTPQDIQDAFVSGRAKTRARSGLRSTSVLKPGDTFALGNRQSDRYFRAYDKRAETHTEGASWLRLELECKNLMARALAQAIAEQANTRAVVNRAVKNYLDLPDMPEYQAALADNSATIPEVPRKQTSTLAWLIDQVCPAMLNYELDHPGVDTLAIVASTLAILRSASVGATADDGSYRGRAKQSS